MTGRLSGKVAIVTGAGSGIGRATAQRLASDGAKVVVNDLYADRAHETVASLDGDGHVAVAGDLADEANAVELARTAVDRYGRIDVLVNNAGIYHIGDITEIDELEFDRVVGSNVKSMVWCCKHVLPHMERQRSGSVINLGSVSAFTGQEHEGRSQWLYNLTKAAAVQLSTSLGTRYAASGIRVNSICPGVVVTNLVRASNPEMAGDADEALLDAVAGVTVPLGRASNPEEIAAAIAFLASDDASVVTASSLIADGGYLAR
jgi:meso-butanediol dehydrogenase/(S,S)-butanediol dehydrogenase/diacetyl reductase